MYIQNTKFWAIPNSPQSKTDMKKTDLVDPEIQESKLKKIVAFSYINHRVKVVSKFCCQLVCIFFF